MRLLTFFVLLMCANMGALAQDACRFGSEDAFNELAKALATAPSCGAAVAKIHDCAWGSSADTQFAPIVISKCEKALLSKMTPAAEKWYADEMQLCAYEYARQDGTMSMSAAALCQVDVASHFATNPTVSGAEPRASFDCGKAETPLEKVICSDVRIGHADIVLSRVYNGLLKGLQGEVRSSLVNNERQWLRSVPSKCGLSSPPGSQSLNCIRNEFEVRFTMLDSCSPEGSIASCWEAPREQEATASVTKPRASFDCEAPSTALEIVICADSDLGQKDISLSQAYQDADHSLGNLQHRELVSSERQWLRSVNASCPLGAVGGIPPVLTRACVRDAYEKRIAQLQTCPRKAPKEQIPCLNKFRH